VDKLATQASGFLSYIHRCRTLLEVGFPHLAHHPVALCNAQGLNVVIAAVDDQLLKQSVQELKSAFPKQQVTPSSRHPLLVACGPE
jgi:hypothetical protein